MESGCFGFINNILLQDFLEEIGVDEFTEDYGIF